MTLEKRNRMKFAASTLIGIDDTGQTCAYGLPMAPSPTRMLSRFWKIHEFEHQNLCKYLELIRCQIATNGVILITEYFDYKCIDELYRKEELNLSLSYSIMQQLCSAIAYCHNRRVIIGLLTLDNILLHYNNKQWNVKLTQYGLYHISGHNADVDCIIGSPWYMAPECLLTNSTPENQENINIFGLITFKSDVWSFGIILLEIFMRKQLSDIWGVKQIISVVSSVISKSDKGSALPLMLDAIQLACPELKITLPSKVSTIIDSCLQIFPSKRPSIASLLNMVTKIVCSSNNDLIAPKVGIDESIEEIQGSILILSLKMTWNNENDNVFSTKHTQKILARIEMQNPTDLCFNRPIRELYFLWKLCGSSVENILISKGVIRMKPPICTLPCLLIDDAKMFGNDDARKVLITSRLCVLPNTNLKDRLHSIHCGDYYHSFELEKEFKKKRSSPNNDINPQTLIVKERDIDYQVFRMSLFSKLLSTYPYNDDILRAESKKDIPPIYRGEVWAALLNVYESEAHEKFSRLDTFSEHISDRQLQVDIPRCHQYDELMTSPIAHYKLKVLLKAWLISSDNDNTGYVYWQGLDSLAAPFLILHFNNIPVAFGCLKEFIEKYLHNFFLKDNSEIIQGLFFLMFASICLTKVYDYSRTVQYNPNVLVVILTLTLGYLAIFMLLVEFIDPELAAHLQALDFLPQLFAIPWFLTCFAHVLPLHKIFHLWDALLLADSSFPLFIGVAILIQLRPRLINAQFNDAILLFSDLPDLSIDNVVSDSTNFYNSVPASCDHPEHKARHCIPNLRNILIQLLSSSTSSPTQATKSNV